MASKRAPTNVFLERTPWYTVRASGCIVIKFINWAFNCFKVKGVKLHGSYEQYVELEDVEKKTE